MRTVGYLHLKNELRNGNLRRVLENMDRVVGPDNYVIYDDGSDDGSLDVYDEHTSHIIKGAGGEFENELFMVQRLLEYCRDELKGDWIVWQDGDTVFNGAATDGGAIQSLIERGEREGITGYGCHWYNCYLHPRWYRTDQRFNDFGQMNIYKIEPGIAMNTAPGLHQKKTPNVSSFADQDEVFLIHLGFASPAAIRQKYMQYWKVGQRGWDLERLISMADLKLELIPDDWMPDHYRPPNPGKPQAYDFDALREKYPALGLDERWMLDEYRKHD